MEKLGLRCTIMNSIDLIKNITYSIYYNMGNIVNGLAEHRIKN